MIGLNKLISKDKLLIMSEEEQLQLLNGMLIKRPLIVNGNTL